ncbi:MAG: ankyrin repeat protein [Rickettsiales bacterium]|jgi:ankyrin repeat protein
MKGVFYCLFISAFLLTSFSSSNIKAQIASIISEDDTGITGITSLMNAAINNDLQAVQFFSRAGSKSIDKQNIGGATALHIAARNNNTKIASTLIENGANINITDNEGWTPLMRASLSGNPSLIRILLNVGAYATKINSFGETAIIHATLSECSECLEQLFSGYDFIKNLNKTTLKDQLSKAMKIAVNKNNEQMKLIIQKYLDDLESESKTLDVLDKEYVAKDINSGVRVINIDSLDNKKNTQKIKKRQSLNHLKKNNIKAYRFFIEEEPKMVKSISSRNIGNVSEIDFPIAKIYKKNIKYSLISGPKGIKTSHLKNIRGPQSKEKELTEISTLEPKKKVFVESDGFYEEQKIDKKPIVTIGMEDEKNAKKNKDLTKNIYDKDGSFSNQNLEQVRSKKYLETIKVKKRFIFLGDKKPFKPFQKTKEISGKVVTPKKKDKIVVKKLFIKKDSPRLARRHHSNSDVIMNSYPKKSDVSVSEDFQNKEQMNPDPQIKKVKFKFSGQKKPFMPLYKK